jgi:hypothetical protein
MQMKKNATKGLNLKIEVDHRPTQILMIYWLGLTVLGKQKALEIVAIIVIGNHLNQSAIPFSDDL